MQLDEVLNLYGADPFANSHAITNRGGRGIGLEVEYDRVEDLDIRNLLGQGRQGMPIALPKPEWSVGHDGSLENGVELTTRTDPAVPTIYEAWHLLEELTPLNEAYEESWRAATQVHVDVGDYSVADLLSLVIRYARYEYQFFGMSGKGRAESNFCVPMWMASDHLTNLMTTMLQVIRNPHKKAMKQNLAAQIDNWPKYMAFNLRPLIQQGTVEFRHLLTPSGENATNLMQSYLSACVALVYPHSPALMERWFHQSTERQTIDSIIGINSAVDRIIRPWYKADEYLKEGDKELWNSMIQRLALYSTTQEEV